MSWPQPEQELDRAFLADLLAVMRRRKLVVLLVAIGVVLGAYAGLNFVTEQYETEARLLVKLGRENVEVPLTVEKGGVYTTGVQKEEINSYVQLLSSQSLIEAAVNRLGLERFEFTPAPPTSLLGRLKEAARGAARFVRDEARSALVTLNLKKELTPRERVVNLLLQSLRVTRDADSNVIRASLRLPDPGVARQALATMLDLYLQRHIELRRVADVREVFEGQTEGYRRELEGVQATLAKIREQWGISSVPQQRQELLARLTQLRRSADEKLSERSRLAGEREALRAQLGVLPGTRKSLEEIEPNPAVQRIKERLVELRLKRIDLTGRYAEDLPLVKTIDEEILGMEALLDKESPTQAGKTAYEPHPVSSEFERRSKEIDVTLAGLEAGVKEDARHAAAIEAELLRLNEGDDRLSIQELERRVVEQKYLTNAARREEARIGEDLDLKRVANIAVLSPPTSSAEPVSPRKLLIMGVAIFAGLVLGVGLALFMEWIGDTIHEPRDLGRLSDVAFLGEFRLDA